MIDSLSLPLVAALAVATVSSVLAGAFFFAFLFYRRKSQRVTRRSVPAGRAEPERRQKSIKRFNPLRGVTFREVLDHNAIAEKIAANAADWIEQSLGEGGMKAIQAAALKESAGRSAKTPANFTLRILAEGQSSKLPTKLQEALSAKKLLETSIAVVPGVITAASPVVPVVVGCFGLISGFEKATPWRSLDEKIKEHLELRALDRLADLQAVFEDLKGELCAEEPDETHLKALRLKLKELRLRAHNEIRLKLSTLKAPLPKAFLWWRWGLSKKQTEMRDQILKELCRLREVQVAIHLEQIIWMTLGQSPVFIDEIIPEIVADLKSLGQLTDERIGWVKGAAAKELAELKSLPVLMAEVLELEIEPSRLEFRVERSRSAA